MHPQPLSTLQKCQSQDHRIEPEEITSDMAQPSLKHVHGERKYWKCFKTDCIGAKDKNNCPNACASCHCKEGAPPQRVDGSDVDDNEGHAQHACKADQFIIGNGYGVKPTVRI